MFHWPFYMDKVETKYLENWFEKISNINKKLQYSVILKKWKLFY